MPSLERLFLETVSGVLDLLRNAVDHLRLEDSILFHCNRLVPTLNNPTITINITDHSNHISVMMILIADVHLLTSLVSTFLSCRVGVLDC